jgi:peptidoglycan/LPS O-acetylase OafA/YrhL
LNRISGLDGLRAIAVTSVMVYHFIPGVDRFAPLGSIGVRLFFVLSGFLITRILLASRNQDTGSAWRTFYIRRSLRIFPLFYLVLALAWAMNISPVRSTIGWHVPYLTNAYLFERGSWHGSISHLWSLAVEEQFYLVWPWLMLLVPEHRIPRLIMAMMCVAPISRLMIGGPMNAVLPTSCLDALGAGALLAFPKARTVMSRIGALAGFPLLIGGCGLRYRGFNPVPIEVALDLGVSLTSAWIVGRVSTSGRGARFLQWKPLVCLGTISYGVYLFHGFVSYVTGRYVVGLFDRPWPTRFVLLSSVTIALASISWFLLEAPMLAFKERFAPRDVWSGRRAFAPSGHQAVRLKVN